MKEKQILKEGRSKFIVNFQLLEKMIIKTIALF